MWEFLEWKKRPSFPIHCSVPMTHIFGSWVSPFSSSFCLIQSLHNGRGSPFSLLPYVGKLLQRQSNVLKPGDGSPHVWWAPGEAQFVLLPSPVQSPHTTHVLFDRQKESGLCNEQLLCKFSISYRFWKVLCKWDERLTEDGTVLWLGWMNATSAWQQNFSKNSRIYSS